MPVPPPKPKRNEVIIKDLFEEKLNPRHEFTPE